MQENNNQPSDNSQPDKPVEEKPQPTPVADINLTDEHKNHCQVAKKLSCI